MKGVDPPPEVPVNIIVCPASTNVFDAEIVGKRAELTVIVSDAEHTATGVVALSVT